MKHSIVHCILLIGSLGSALGAGSRAHLSDGTKHESPFACNVNAFTETERKRHFDELGPKLRSLRKEVRELKDGYEFRFEADQKTFGLVTEWAHQESRCCPFLRIEIRLEQEEGPLWLKLTGRKGTKEFILEDFAPWLKE